MKRKSIVTFLMATSMVFTLSSCDYISNVINAILGKKQTVEVKPLDMSELGIKARQDLSTKQFTTTGSTSSQVSQYVNEINQSCPMALSQELTMSYSTIEGKNMVVYMEVNEYYCDMDDLAANMSKSNARGFLSSMGGPMLRALSNANMNLIFRYVGNSSGQQAQVKFTPQEMRSMVN
ncbi:MAG: hypothetical protein IJ925_01090 [Muribaculaceae bacterium]|nr:hypothetical protein [Muribaculaceae bacterium]